MHNSLSLHHRALSSSPPSPSSHPPPPPSLPPSLHHLLCQRGTGGSPLLCNAVASCPRERESERGRGRSGRKWERRRGRRRPTEGCDFLDRGREREQQVLRSRKLSKIRAEIFLSRDITSCPRTGKAAEGK
ncbi:hypothetical protein EYF80_063450 [Liparis tanakae]|uniref:Uncharacterized protein n=1 Tax=Liparis tanakae TaxID=230148 RepID=A0A4Z2ECG6_9TELE|nr:hypothetical protein EYF80_063450 [Liparis tanakae]